MGREGRGEREGGRYGALYIRGGKSASISICIPMHEITVEYTRTRTRSRTGVAGPEVVGAEPGVGARQE